jgi:1-acyl-sn-glycerol-3-phosphate acyltransferase
VVVRVEVTNRHERFDGPAVVVSNHPHWIDGAVAVQADRSLRPIARWQSHLGARFAIWAGNAVVTTAGTGRDPRPAYLQAADHLEAGGRIWLAPEGGSHQNLRLRTPRSGAVRMAHAAGVPIQPLAIAHEAGGGSRPGRWRPWHRPIVRVCWGPIVHTTGDVGADNDRMMTCLSRVSGLVWSPPDGAPTTSRAAVDAA